MEIVDSQNCTGCTACVNTCPQKAISLQEDDKGFLRPIINEKLCNKCNKCKQVCPSLNRPKAETIYNVYAGWNLDKKIRVESSSGGIFTAIAEDVINSKGYICGACFKNQYQVEHIIISDKKDLYKMRGSKYVQSNLNNVFKEIKRLLDENKKVLFSGTACQVYGLKRFLKKEYDNLITIDVICHGVPSPKIFKEYISQMEKDKNKKISEVNFREKSDGWRNPQILLKSKEEIIEKEKIYDDIFGKAFLTNMILRESCYNCTIPTIKSQSDITLGDFWGGWTYKQELDDKLGVSLIITHTDIGDNLIKKMKNIKIYHEIPLKTAINNNYPIALPSLKHPNSNSFFNEYMQKKENVKILLDKYLNNSYTNLQETKSVGILNFHYENYNFGANLVAYSLLRTIEKLGYNAKIINYAPFEDLKPIDKIPVNSFKLFRSKFLQMTNLFTNSEELYKLNNYFDTFIVGSDQVWRKTITSCNFAHYFFDFANPLKKIISYSASFGTEKWEGNDEETAEVKKLLKRFQHVSVREDDGIDICKNTFDITARRDIDPTLLILKEEYQKIIDSEEHESINKEYVAYYFLFDNERNDINNKHLLELLKKEKLSLINIKGYEQVFLKEKKFMYNSISSWLNYIKNAKLVITDSYHGVLFAILYNKPFICILKNCKSLSRFQTLFSLLDIKKFFFFDFEEIDTIPTVKDINYNEINKILEYEREKSILFLKNALEEKQKNKQKILEENWLENIKEINTLKQKKSNLEIYYVELNEKYRKECNNIVLLNEELDHLSKQEELLVLKISELNNNEEILKEKVQELEKQISNSNKIVNNMLNSTSWKITAPIRKIKTILNNLR